PDEFDRVLGSDESAVAKRVYGLDRPANFEDPHGGGKAWHVQIADDTAGQSAAAADTAGENAAPEPPDRTGLLDSARSKLLAAREQRVWPGRDEKILAGWNGLAIRALARAARQLGRDDLAEAAARALDFVRERMWQNGRLLATWKDGRARFPAYLDDYA